MSLQKTYFSETNLIIMSDEPSSQQGSWLPLLLICFLLVLRWVVYSQGNVPVRLRRWYNTQRLELKKKLGYRDDSRYKMGAGDGANQKYKRQG